LELGTAVYNAQLKLVNKFGNLNSMSVCYRKIQLVWARIWLVWAAAEAGTMCQDKKIGLVHVS